MSNDLTNVKDALPLIGVGVMGAAVRSINQRPFSLRGMLIRLCTAGFASSLALMFLSITDYPRAVQGGICGVVGALGIELLEAVRIRIFKEIAGEPPHETITGEEYHDGEAVEENPKVD